MIRLYSPTSLIALIVCLQSFVPTGASGQTAPDSIASLITAYRADARGPYSGIFWFCSNGSVRAARDPCPNDDKAHQHADYKPAVKRLMRDENLHLAPILADQSYADFWDAENDHSRTKQYQLNGYLTAIDNGWILEKARYYRGAFQVEDEEEWGRNFFRWLLARERVLAEDYYLVLQAARDIPHRGDTDLNQQIRAVSREIADAYPEFMELRIKIHGKPGGEDAGAVLRFAEDHAAQLKERKLYRASQTLAADITEAYGGSGLTKLSDLYATLPATDTLHTKLGSFIEVHPESSQSRLTAAADLALTVRRSLVADDRSAAAKLVLVDFVNELGDLVFRNSGEWMPATAREQMEKICYLSEAAAGLGFVELWEFDNGGSQLADPNYQYIFPEMLDSYLDNARRFVEWGTATNRATYAAVVERYAAFEPKALSFLDDRVRGSVLLPLGEAVGRLGDWLADNSENGNSLMDIGTQAQARGLNPGYARGTLRIIDGAPDDIQVNNRDIFVFSRPPADLKPVGGILTVSEGNMVSHVQLLARNLGIPNAVLTDRQFAELKPYDGREVFFAVSSAGTVLMKPADGMTARGRTALQRQGAQSGTDPGAGRPYRPHDPRRAGHATGQQYGQRCALRPQGSQPRSAEATLPR